MRLVRSTRIIERDPRIFWGLSPSSQKGAWMAPKRVMVAVPTFRRVGQLVDLLPLVRAQARATVTSVPDVAVVDVVVIDNDPACSAENVVSGLDDVRYVTEPEPGLAAVRNRALDEAAQYDAIVFIDDDEVPGRTWLEHLVRRWREIGSCGVAGPAVPVFPPGASPWVRRCGVLDLPDFPDGSPLPGGATNNLLLDIKELRALGVRFDERFGTTGGEDTMLCRSIISRGGVIVWCADAVVTDPVPGDRATRRWMLTRAFRAGTTWTRVAVLDAGGLGVSVRAHLILKAIARILRATVTIVVRGGPWSPSAAAATCALAGGIGVIVGVAGHRHSEYARHS